MMSKSFRTAVERFHGNGLNWTIARLPFSVEKAWNRRGLFKVHVQVNGFEFRTSLFPDGRGGHYLLVNKKVQKGAKIGPGSVATFLITPDLAPREVRVPPELEQTLARHRTLRKWFNQLNHSIRKWLSDMVADAKAPETRRKRAERIAEVIMEAMEAERELPPLIRMVFGRTPGADAAWRSMTELQRRANLLAVFNYRTPQSRIKRIERIFTKPEDRDE